MQKLLVFLLLNFGQLLSNIYFPTMLKDFEYIPKSKAPFPHSFPSLPFDNRIIVQWYISNKILIVESTRKPENGGECVYFQMNLSNLEKSCIGNGFQVGEHWITLQIKKQKTIVILQVDCEKTSVLISFQYSNVCQSTSHENHSNFILIGRWLKNGTSIMALKFKCFYVDTEKISIIVWWSGSSEYRIISLDFNGETLNSESKTIPYQNFTEIRDLTVVRDVLIISTIERCLFQCWIWNCSSMEMVTSLDCKNEKISSGLFVSADQQITIPESENSSKTIIYPSTLSTIIQLTRFSAHNSDMDSITYTYHCLFTVYCASYEERVVDFPRIATKIRECGSFSIENLAQTYASQAYSPEIRLPCKLSRDSKLLGCLVLGEPYIFDVSDGNSAHPISTFPVISVLMGEYIYRFSFSSDVTFSVETSGTLDITHDSNNHTTMSVNSRGLVFEIYPELQPTLIASHVIFPTISTAYQPGESYFLTNHVTHDIYLIMKSGRVFHHHPSPSLAYSINMEFKYCEFLSFFISDLLADYSIYASGNMQNHSEEFLPSSNYGHNMEHPFAFFSPDKQFMVYISFYRTLRKLTYSALSIVKLGVERKPKRKADFIRTIVYLSGTDNTNRVLHSGVSHKNQYLVTVQALFSEGFLTVSVFDLQNLPHITSSSDSMVAKTLIPGTWHWLNLWDEMEAARIWVIPFVSNRIFFIAVHSNATTESVDKLSTVLVRLHLNHDLTIKETGRFYLNSDCTAITNTVDYSAQRMLILCVHFIVRNKISFFFQLINFSESTISSVCIHRLPLSWSFHQKSTESSQSDNELMRIPLYDLDTVSNRLSVAYGSVLHLYDISVCPFTRLYSFHHAHLISAVTTNSVLHKNSIQPVPFIKSNRINSLVAISYLQKVDVLTSCINGFGEISIESPLINSTLTGERLQVPNFGAYCSRCSPGTFGLGCQPCPAGFICAGYGQLQPTSPCPEGYYCLERTKSFPIQRSETGYSLHLDGEPQQCPPGAYCPAGTSFAEANDSLSSAPQFCMEGYYCPRGSSTPTENKCPDNSSSTRGANSISDCRCKSGYFGDIPLSGACLKCLPNAICPGNELPRKPPKVTSLLYIPEGQYPNTPYDCKSILPCQISPSRYTPCQSTSCQLLCHDSKCHHKFMNEKCENVNSNLKKCRTVCENPCKNGHRGRLCSNCADGYYPKNSAECRPCVFTFPHIFWIGGSLLITVGTFLFMLYRRRKLKSNQSTTVVEEEEMKKKMEKFGNDNERFSDGQLLEIILAVLFVSFGASSSSSLLFLIFIVLVMYLQQLDSPPYAKNIFIFHIQTLQALLTDRFIMPEAIDWVLSHLDAIYAPIPGLACLPNLLSRFYTPNSTLVLHNFVHEDTFRVRVYDSLIFTDKNVGWFGAYAIILIFPIVCIFPVVVLTIIRENLQKDESYSDLNVESKAKNYQEMRYKIFEVYFFVLTILQFPVGTASLSLLACSQDEVTQEWYVSSHPWLSCEAHKNYLQFKTYGLPQHLAIFGAIFYFLVFPFIMNFVYWKKVLPKKLHEHISYVMLQSGLKEKRSIYHIFLNLRAIFLAVILTPLIPAEWKLDRTLLFLLLCTNVFLLIRYQPYEIFSNSCEHPHQHNIQLAELNLVEKSKIETDEVEITVIRKLRLLQSGELCEILSLIVLFTSFIFMDYPVSNMNANDYAWKQEDLKKYSSMLQSESGERSDGFTRENAEQRSMVIIGLNLLFFMYLTLLVLLERRLKIFKKLHLASVRLCKILKLV